MKMRQERELLRLYDAARRLERELLIEIIAGKNGPVDDRTIARVIDGLYEIGIKPDWWKLECQANKTAWDNIARVIETGDPLCRGVLLLGLEAPEKDLRRPSHWRTIAVWLKASQSGGRSSPSRRWSG